MKHPLWEAYHRKRQTLCMNENLCPMLRKF
jgi:hypothetical protein